MTVVALIVAGSIEMLNVALKVDDSETEVAPAAGAVETTVGAPGEVAATVNVQEYPPDRREPSAASTLLPRCAV